MVAEADRIAAAQSYIDALVSHDADAVPFAPSCVRIEQGVRTGLSGNHLRRSLNRGLQFRLIAAATRPAYTVVGDEVRAVYDVVTKPRLFGRQVAARIDETFLIPADDGLIHHIRARFRPYLRRT
ncbi:hypothetical protein BMW24_006630 [Mycobacterium heckeshornense]|uniref:DUF8021 domain-containing protein n=1 Tax=Mycobacterium heckeshornense TaxID=110505 RepID=A0A2G8BF39_9MYCO|nr:hypothetical protein [Mycobacterium heckeshornense]KMV22870.1 hypothetical protein ACT16_09035 [Mycobacterium heckeshornense]MCV7033795.1 hypothetical protein [Mycobacterium heckeshornense]PIJ36354.1 hypothetical protein BMW24_006630 [Mycobacterium heckeshornense]BCO34032.1 hypothetical protein MHEC_04650 [Mycobacterium heckeshornense]BCQ07085.1 hypothetical protein JMUB5695_00501 [Mycobacterium heckeshornense]